MKKVFIVNFLITILSFVCFDSSSQHVVQNQYKFRYLTVDEGLSSNNILAIGQDSVGFIWIGTGNGIDKYDGQTIVSYRHNPNDSNSLSSNVVNSIFLDSKKNLWICTNEGLDLYNADLDNFIHFKHKDINWPLGITHSLVEDNNSTLWIGASTGLYAYNLTTSKIRYFSNKEGNKNGFPRDDINRLLVDRDNNIWIGFITKGLCEYNQKNKKFTFFKNNPDDISTISGNRIHSLYQDKKGRIWAGTLNNGLNLYIPGSNSFERIIPDPNNSYANRVRAIFEDTKGDFFIGTRVGLYLRNKHTNKFIPYAYEGHIVSKLSQNSVYCQYIDRTGTLWIGTFSGGVNYTNLNRKGFITYSAGTNDNHFLIGNNIYAITEDPKGNLWIGGDNGLNFLDRTTNTFKYYVNDPNDPNSLSYNDVKAFAWDKKGNLWVATNNGGLDYYNVCTGRFKAYKHNPEDPASISADKVFGILCDKANNLWVLTSSAHSRYLTINILPDGSDKFIHPVRDADHGLDQDEKGNVYIGRAHGFWKFTRKDSTYRFVSNDTLIGDVNVIKFDSENKLWIGGDKGLVRYNPKDNSFLSYSENNGYPVKTVYGILEDDKKSLWVSTNFGLVKITNVVKDTGKIKFRVYDSDDGLQSKQFNFNAYFKCKSGEMIFGGIKGINTFFPDKIVDDTIPPNVIITDLIINNQSTPIGKKTGGQIILKKSISVTDEITLGKNQNIFTLVFSSLQNANPKKNIYKYKLEGFDNNWQYRKAGNNNATYTNLPAGRYTFMVTAANNDNVWNKNPVTLKINIIPPFWKTWWFITLVSLLFIALIISIVLYRTYSIKQQNLALEKVVKKRTLEISEKNRLLEENQEEILTQKEELEHHKNNLESLVADRTKKLEMALEKAKESDALKSAFLANMSHEIRTPMNAITGFSGLLNEEELSPQERNEYADIIQTNANDLLKIIDEILDLSLMESNQLKLTIEPFHLNSILDYLYSYYYLNNKNPKVEIRKNNLIHDLDIKLNSDSLRLKQILINLMDNACKFTKKGYVEIGALINKENLCLYVEDTGRGIQAKNINYIFQQFAKVEDNETEWIKGLGLGLTISQKISDALGGKLFVKSEPEKGSKFTFCIPVKKIITEKEIVVRHLGQALPIPKRWQGKTILIAEDVEANFLFIREILKKTKTNIIWAKNGKDTLKEALENNKIDLILMDIKMPAMNGYEVAQEIKKHNPDQKIIAQTAYARPEERVNFHDNNFDEYLSKPINPAELIRILEKFL